MEPVNQPTTSSCFHAFYQENKGNSNIFAVIKKNLDTIEHLKENEKLYFSSSGEISASAVDGFYSSWTRAFSGSFAGNVSGHGGYSIENLTSFVDTLDELSKSTMQYDEISYIKDKIPTAIAALKKLEELYKKEEKKTNIEIVEKACETLKKIETRLEKLLEVSTKKGGEETRSDILKFINIKELKEEGAMKEARKIISERGIFSQVGNQLNPSQFDDVAKQINALPISLLQKEMILSEVVIKNEEGDISSLECLENCATLLNEAGFNEETTLTLIMETLEKQFSRSLKVADEEKNIKDLSQIRSWGGKLVDQAAEQTLEGIKSLPGAIASAATADSTFAALNATGNAILTGATAAATFSSAAATFLAGGMGALSGNNVQVIAPPPKDAQGK